MKREEVRARIEEIGVIPLVRVCSVEEASFAAEAVAAGGIPIVEMSMTECGGKEAITHLVRSLPHITVGAGSVLDLEMARFAVDQGAQFLTSEGFDREVVDFAVQAGVVVFPGALTPTEIMVAWKAGSDFVKVFPCSQLGSENYIRALRAAWPHVPLIAAGGVNQTTAGSFILAGASALGVGKELIPKEAVRQRRLDWISELAKRFVGFVKTARTQTAAWNKKIG
jgi:2-dehydro-3-deoxyphosphogluconate aldolase/(4S)-4-hydroxy-2-oxoglutarate aldolase